MRPRAAWLLPLLLLAACSGGKSATSAGEDKQLDDAAASLEANSADTNAAEIVDEDGSGNKDQPQ